MSSLHTILEDIQALSKQINFNMVFAATNILISQSKISGFQISFTELLPLDGLL
jgi:hypothetical protein